MHPGFQQFEGAWGPNAQLAWDTLALRPTKGIPSTLLFVMDWALLEEMSGHPQGAYREKPEDVYRDFQLACGTCQIDQWIPRNPLTMTDQGFESSTERGPTTGAEGIILDGMTDRDGNPLMIWAGVSVTTTLPHGTKDDVKKQLKWLVESGPRVGLFLGGSSSIAPGTNRENVKTLIEGLRYYRNHGRGYSRPV